MAKIPNARFLAQPLRNKICLVLRITSTPYGKNAPTFKLVNVRDQ